MPGTPCMFGVESRVVRVLFRTTLHSLGERRERWDHPQVLVGRGERNVPFPSYLTTKLAVPFRRSLDEWNIVNYSNKELNWKYSSFFVNIKAKFYPNIWLYGSPSMHIHLGKFKQKKYQPLSNILPKGWHSQLFSVYHTTPVEAKYFLLKATEWFFKKKKRKRWKRCRKRQKKDPVYVTGLFCKKIR